MDGFVDTCDAIFSRQDRQTRLKILSDTHTGAFAVMGCVVILMLKSFLFAEIFSQSITSRAIFFVPVYSRLGMAILLNNLPFAKDNGLAVNLGASRNSRDNIFLAGMFIVLTTINFSCYIPVMFAASLAMWCRVCIKIFGGITGDLLGAFVEISEALSLTGIVFVNA